MKKVSWEERGRREFNSLKVPPYTASTTVNAGLTVFSSTFRLGCLASERREGKRRCVGCGRVGRKKGKLDSWSPSSHLVLLKRGDRGIMAKKARPILFARGNFSFCLLLLSNKYGFFSQDCLFTNIIICLHRLGKLLSRRGRSGLLFSTNRHCALLVPPAECRAKTIFATTDLRKSDGGKKVQ